MTATAPETEVAIRPDSARDDALVLVTDLHKHFPIKKPILLSRQWEWVRAGDSVSSSLREGRTVGIVVESRCVKSTI